MAAGAQRLRRVADQIQRELAAILHGEIGDPRVKPVTITGVEVSPDLAHAKVFFTTLEPGPVRDASLDGLRRAAGFMRSLLGRRRKTHNVPELHFEFDRSIEQGFRLSQLIDAAVASQRDEDAPS